MRKIHLFLATLICLAMPLQAQFFENKEEKLAKHVAEVLREPTRIIAQATAASEAGDVDEAMVLFKRALTLITQIETDEDTKGSAYSALRLKKFHCASMLDDLALRQSEVKDVRQAVTDTSDLEAKLAALRNEGKSKDQPAEEKAPEAAPFSPAQSLLKAESDVAKSQVAYLSCDKQTQAAKEKLNATRDEFVVAARERTRADAAFTSAKMAVDARDKKDEKTLGMLAQMQQDMTSPDETLKQAQAHLAESEANFKRLRDAVAQAEKVVKEAEAATAQSKVALDEAVSRQTLYRTIVSEEEARLAELARKEAEAEERRLQAEALLKAQREAEAAAKKRAEIERAAAVQAASKKAKAEAAAKAAQLAEEIAWCKRLWLEKRVVDLESSLLEAMKKNPHEPQFILLLARLRLLQGQYDDALELVTMIPTNDPSDMQAKMVAAGAYLSLKRPLDAMKLLEAALKAYPKAPEPSFNMAALYVSAPHLDSTHTLAERYYRRSVELGGKRSPGIESALHMEKK